MPYNSYKRLSPKLQELHDLRESVSAEISFQKGLICEIRPEEKVKSKIRLAKANDALQHFFNKERQHEEVNAK